MLRRWSFVSVTILVCLSVAGLAVAQTVDELVARNLEAKGGAAKINAVTTVKMTGRATRVVYREARPRRSTKKTVLFIGGSTATGAGIGGLVGGKKGALIGAAIGGGASSIYESGKTR